jgi:hypothetical protein
VSGWSAAASEAEGRPLGRMDSRVEPSRAMRSPAIARLERLADESFRLWALERATLLADDVGRLSRHLSRLTEDYSGTYTSALVERVAGHVETLHLVFRATAAERFQAGATVEQALAETDREAAELRRRLGLTDRRAAA